MKNEQKSKQLEMALTEHKTMIIDTGDNQKFRLTWDESINDYRGASLQTNMQIGIWSLEFLFDIANGKEKGLSLEVAYE